MTPEERDLIMSLVLVPGQAAGDHRDEVLHHFQTSDGKQLGHKLLDDAIGRQDGTDVEMALIVGNTFGFTRSYLEPLIRLSSADWHQKHEDVVDALGQLGDPAAVAALYHATQWIPDYLDYDDSRALARKAVWAIGKTPGSEAEAALKRLAGSDDEIVREEAERQLRHR